MGERVNNQRTAKRLRMMRERNYRRIKALLIIIVMAVVFFAGFALRGQSALLQSLGFPSSITGIDATSNTDPNAAQHDVFNSVSARLAQVEDVLADDSLDTYNLEDATIKTLSAFAESSDDPYLRYYSPARYAALLNDADESYAGIGVLFSEYAGQAYVVDVFEGSQAQLEGVQEGDFVVAINGDNSQTWSRSEVTAVLSQAEGESVIITWRRPESLESAGGEEFTTTLQCEEYDEVNVTTIFDEDRYVGYIRVRQITQNVATLAQNAIVDLSSQGARAYVLDIRDCPGGYLNQAVDLASLFMTGGTVVEVQTVDGISSKAATGKPATDAPLVVLVNKNTAAAAEVVAAALKDSQRGTIVGETTMGKGSVQVMYELSFGGALRYTAAYYLTPEGHSIDNVGVTPEVTIGSGDDGDAQYDYAMSLAGSMGAA